MKVEIIREILRPYAGDIVDEEVYEFLENCRDKYEELITSIQMTEKYPFMVLYVEMLLKKFTVEELNSRIVDDPNSEEESILSSILFYNYDEKIIKMLVEAGLNINAHQSSGYTPLANCVFDYDHCEHQLKHIELYLKNGADVNLKFYFRKKMYTVLSLIFTNKIKYFDSNSIDVVKLLLNYGATYDLEQIENYGLEKDIKEEIIKHIDSLTGKYTKSAKKV